MRRRNEHREASGKHRILSWALAGHVIHQADWWIRGADGGSPIRAVRSRIPELESEGYGFHHTTRDDGSVEYRLAQVPAPTEPEDTRDALSAPDPPPDALSLFDAPEPAPAAAMHPDFYDWDGDE